MKELRQAVKLKAEQVAVELDVSVSTVRNWEQGRTMPKLRLDQFCKLVRLYKCSPDELEKASMNSLAKSDLS